MTNVKKNRHEPHFKGNMNWIISEIEDCAINASKINRIYVRPQFSGIKDKPTLWKLMAQIDKENFELSVYDTELEAVKALVNMIDTLENH